MLFQIKSGWFGSYLRVQGESFSISIDLVEVGNEARFQWTWIDNSVWRLVATNDEEAFTLMRDDTAIARGRYDSNGDIQWNTELVLDNLSFKVEWSGWRRIDRVYTGKGQMIMEARHGWLVEKVALDDTFDSWVPLFIAVCIARKPSPFT